MAFKEKEQIKQQEGTATVVSRFLDKRKDYSMGKIYFIAEATYGEEVTTSDELCFIADTDGKRILDDIFQITSFDDFMSSPNKEEFIQTIFPMAEDYFSEDGTFDYVMLTAIDKNTHIFLWGIKVERRDKDHIEYSCINWKDDPHGKFSYHQHIYNITNNIKARAYVQWLEGFVSSVLNNAEIECSEVSIDDVEPSKRIYLTVDGTDYTIRTWDYTPIHYDDKGNPDYENIRYTLFKSVEDELGSHGEEVEKGIIPIYWDNEEV